MSVGVACPKCGSAYGVDASYVGRLAVCPNCGESFSVSGTRVDDRAGAAVPLVPEPVVGLRFADRYQVEAKLGAGGMGAVYRALDLMLDRPVALKVPHFRAEEDLETIQRFEREARIAAKFDHPNLCPVLDVNRFQGARYLTMPLIDGEPLSKVLRPDPDKPSVPMEQAQAAQVARIIARALAEAHSKGVVHRDLKPANVLMHRKRGPVVVDFGLARPDGPEEVRLTKTGAALGTPAYMAPEQVDGDLKAIGPRTDVYALGVLLYELLTGRLPFEGRTAASIYVQIMHGAATPPSDHRPEVDPALAAIALKAMSRAPADRYASMDEFAQALIHWRDARPGRASITPEKLTDTPTAEPPSAVVPVWPRRRSPWLIAALPIGALLLVALGLIIRIATDRGTITLDIADPASVGVVAIDGRVVELDVLGEPITLVSGEHNLKVTRRDFETQTQFFTVKRGDERKVITVTYETKVADPESRPATVPPAEEARPVPRTPGADATGLAKAETKPAEPEPDRTPPPPVDPKEFTNPLGMKLVRIERGSFDMGSTDAQIEQVVKLYPQFPASTYDDEKPRHRVEITKPFYLGAHEVTVGQFRQFVDETGYKTDAEKDGKGGYGWDEEKGTFTQDPKYAWRSPGFPQSDDHPVVNLSHNDAVAFCAWLTERDAGVTYRLPTEAEWEYAARAGTGGLYPNGDDPDKLTEIGNVADATAKRKYANWTTVKGDDGYVYTAPVGSFAASRWGLHDMIGNVWEWCADGYDAKYYAGSPAAVPPGAPSASLRVDRGGCWFDDGWNCRSAFRFRFAPEVRSFNLGFRVAAVRAG